MDVEVAHKSKTRGTATSSVPLSERIVRARYEGRFQHALELARQQYKQDPSEANLALVRQVSFERGQQLQAQGQLTEAATVFGNCVDMGGPPEFQRKLAEKLAACGNLSRSLTLMQSAGDSQSIGKVLASAVDQAVSQGRRQMLPADLQPQFDNLLQAFAQAEAGHDEQVGTLLQSIGLQSPFMEWRTLLRGLLAYYAKDDQRAMEIWQRLDPKRLPARLAAPLRFGLDAGYRAAQAPAAQNLLRQQFDRLQGVGLVAGLRSVQALLTQEDRMPQAFRLIEGHVAALRKQAPDLVARLAACFRWAIIDVGNPEDQDRYARLFGTPPDDPKLHRMAALALEKRGYMWDAHEAWQMFEKDVAGNPGIWPGDTARHVRALVWAHIGTIAAVGTDDLEDDEGDDFDEDDFFGREEREDGSFRPSAEECLRKSLELAPEVLSTHEALLGFYMERKKPAQAIEAGKKLLEHFPDHALALETLGTLAMVEGRLPDARAYFQRAVRANPLERRLRFQLGKLHELQAREHSANKRYDEARSECQSALAMHDTSGRHNLTCLAAIIELKTKNTQRFEELVAQAEKEARNQRLPIVHALMCKGFRQKLTPAQKKPFVQEFEAALGRPLAPAFVGLMVEQMLAQRLAGPPYRGQKAHEKKILSLVENASLKEFPEKVLANLCCALKDLQEHKLRKRCLDHARKRFPANPDFLLEYAEYLLQHARNTYQAERSLSRAHKLIEALPDGERKGQLRERVAELEEDLHGRFNPMNLMFRRMMGFGFADEEDY